MYLLNIEFTIRLKQVPVSHKDSVNDMTTDQSAPIVHSSFFGDKFV